MEDRNYQSALLEKCVRDNTIIYLPTGTGKSFIAVMAMKRLGLPLLGENHKVTIVLVNTVALVEQHTKYVKKHTTFTCGGYTGEMNVDYWSQDVWMREFEKHQVMVMTSEILAGLVRSNICDLNRVNLLVFDECHHGVNEHSMRMIMTNFQNLVEEPRVVGLTATLLNGNCKPDKVEETVRQLEVTFHSKIASVDGLETVVGYATNPTERLWSYRQAEPNDLQKTCMKRVEDLVEVCTKLNIDNKTKINERLFNKSLKPLTPNEGLKVVKNLLKDFLFHLELVGIYGAPILCTTFCISLEVCKRKCSEGKLCHFFNYLQTALFAISQKFESAMVDCRTEKERFWKYSSRKIIELLRILDDFAEKSEENLCGLIFTERRFTAKILFLVLDQLSKCDTDYSYLKCNYIIGNNNNPNCQTRDKLYCSKKNSQVLKDFVNKDINVLFSSQVLEEGIDIPKCTLVCKFDVPKDYRSYIQSKGRARHKKSFYYMMVESRQYDKFKANYDMYQRIEKMLNDLLIGRTEERDAPCKLELDLMYNETYLPPYYANGPGSAYFTEVNAIPLLARYCNSLPCDNYTCYAPEYYYQNDEYITVTVLLPKICPLNHPIQGLPMRNKKMAKRVAAYEACKRLHQCGELDDSLLPCKRTLSEEEVSFLFKHRLSDENEMRNKKKHLHNMQIPKCCRGQLYSEQPIYLHIIHLKPVFQKPIDDEGSATLFDMYVSNLCFGILTPEDIPKVPSSPIYVHGGAIEVSITENVRQLFVDAETLAKIQEFHFALFNDVLKIFIPFLVIDCEADANSMFVVPVRKDMMEIDFDTIEKHRTIRCENTGLTHSEKVKLVVNDEEYLQKIVTATYRRDQTTYVVTEVCSHMSPLSPFPNSDFKNFQEYYAYRHQINIVNLNQPLLQVKALSSKLNLYRPEGLGMKRRKDKMYEHNTEFLIPELLIKQDYPGELWIQARFLPTILHRLFYMLRVEELWCRIGRACGFLLQQDNMLPITANINLITYKTSDLETDTTDHISRKGSEETGEKLLALTSSVNNSRYRYIRVFENKMLESKYPWKDLDEPKDIERTNNVSVMDIEAYVNFLSQTIDENETKQLYKSPVKRKQLALQYNKDFVQHDIRILEIDEAVIEFRDIYEALTTSKANDVVNLERLETLGDSFLKFACSYYILQRFPSFDEGRATQLKGRMISNVNLFHLGRVLNIGGIIKNKNLSAKDEWLPPGFCIPQELRRLILQKKLSINCLFKCNFSRSERTSGEVDLSRMEALLNEYSQVETEEEVGYESMDLFMKQQCLSNKCVADGVEALIGSILKSTGIDGGLKVLEFIGIIPTSENITEMFQKEPVKANIKQNISEIDVQYHLPFAEEIEEIIGYTFRDKCYLLQALTHASYTLHRLTMSYENLEFLGDAILDFLITCHIFETCRHMTPGDLTDLRSALVNNSIFASYVVRLGLQKFLLMVNSKLQSQIDGFDDFLAARNFEISDEVLILLQEGELNLAEYIDVPKVLGDIFEALAGAIFLDSGCDLQQVWRVFYKIMWREIDKFSQNIPKNLVRRLYEFPNAHPIFEDSKQIEEGRTLVKLSFFSEGKKIFVRGYGSNKAGAKVAAAKIALRILENH